MVAHLNYTDTKPRNIEAPDPENIPILAQNPTERVVVVKYWYFIRVSIITG